ncbi:hypothetical protein [Prevotella jejuni]
MIDVSKKFFLCYAWEDTARIQNILKEVEYEIKAKVSAGLTERDSNKVSDDDYKGIEDADVFVIFISNSSKKSDYVKECAIRAANLNKNVISIEIDRQNIFTSIPSELKFRAKPYIYDDTDSRAKLFAQLKASLGFNMESGDDYGTLVHIVTNRNSTVYRYGEKLGSAKAGEDCKIRLTKGSHLLEFVDIEDSTLRIAQTVNINSNDNEQFVDVDLNQLFKQKKTEEERVQRQVEMKKQFEEDEYNKLLLNKQKEREEELQRREQELLLQKQEQEQELQRKKKEQEEALQRHLLYERQAMIKSQQKKNSFGCSWFLWVIGIFILCSILGMSLL